MGIVCKAHELSKKKKKRKKEGIAKEEYGPIQQKGQKERQRQKLVLEFSTIPESPSARDGILELQDTATVILS